MCTQVIKQMQQAQSHSIENFHDFSLHLFLLLQSGGDALLPDILTTDFTIVYNLNVRLNSQLIHPIP